MRDDVADQFDELAQKVIEDSERIKCNIGDFYQGLRMIIKSLEERLETEQADTDRGKP